MIVFGAVAALAMVGGDCFGSSQKAGVARGAFGAAAHVDSFGARVEGGKAAGALKEGQPQPAGDHLPAAIAGWSRRERHEDDGDRFFPGRFEVLDATVEELGGKGEVGPLGAMVAADRTAFLRETARTGWVDERGDEAVFLRETFTKPRGNRSISSRISDIAIGSMAAMRR